LKHIKAAIIKEVKIRDSDPLESNRIRGMEQVAIMEPRDTKSVE